MSSQTAITEDTTQAGVSPEDFSLFDPAVSSNPYEFYRALRNKCPVYKIPERGFYLISRYQDLDSVLRDTVNFSSFMERVTVMQGENSKLFLDILREKGWEPVPALQRSDPPKHTRYRKFIDRAFNMKEVRNIEARIVKLAHELIDQFIDKGECDFIDEFSLPLPGMIVAEMIGLDAKDYRRFKRWADNLLAYYSRIMNVDELCHAAETEVEMQQFVAGVFEDRRKNPKDDLMTGLITPQEGVEPLNMHELQNIMHQLISGGYETTTSAINHAVWQMIRFPKVAAEVRADRSLMRNFINESLRWESPVQGLYRTAVKDVELGGTLIPKGSLCNVRYAAANRDEREFPNPDNFDIHRENNALHLAFGAPPHFCPGAVLARTEMSVAINALFDRMDSFELANPLPDPVHVPSAGFMPMKELKLKFKASRPA